MLPTYSDGVKMLNPGMAASLMVALGLLSLALITIGNLGLFDNYLMDNISDMAIY